MKLKTIGLNLCFATKPANKVHEIFDVIQEGGKNYISVRDKEMKQWFYDILSFEMAVVVTQSGMNASDPAVQKA